MKRFIFETCNLFICLLQLKYSAWADKITGNTFKLDGPFQGFSLYEPMGVVGGIIPWNFPMIAFVSKAIPALAAGNTVIIKPAEQTPLTALYLATLAKKVCAYRMLYSCVGLLNSTRGRRKDFLVSQNK
jgi:acyl-CoA reductase-like NAD-dependent aldehyde dehydrogenase